jgi:hypothetical protein
MRVCAIAQVKEEAAKRPGDTEQLRTPASRRKPVPTGAAAWAQSANSKLNPDESAVMAQKHRKARL